MKTPSTVLADVRRRLDRTWPADVAGTATSWPHRFAIGAPTKTQLESGWTNTYQPLIRQWRDWAKAQPVILDTEPRRVHTTVQDIPTHVEVAALSTAAQVAGGDWPHRLDRARGRLLLLTQRFPYVGGLDRILKALNSYSELDFELVLKVSEWFRTNDVSGLTPRQVPVPGVHAKWLNTRHAMIAELSGRESLGLLPRHPARVHFTYLDPVHRASGARSHDSATVGDSFIPAYQPELVIISENKDTAIHFPPLPGAIAVEGEGFGGKTAAALPWLTGAPHLYYWGDIDSHGYEILNGWRSDGVPVQSVLMDLDTYDAFEPFGTNVDRNGQALRPGNPKPLSHLTSVERAVYHRLLDPGWTGNRRIEQERIPLSTAVAAITVRSR
ncbi:Wadjet anti-phage system protein JetD domain-containing protein [Actinosynnema sp. CS-041913]|uniref:Wadjet anti-phage system protein JetD domain-containing protein n=1 Tax=Actinosynnema sp. CS-041913 TaxID=3239917 RepID=UPI003D8B6200